MTPLVSVYITNYNYGSFIKEAIESVLNQFLNDFELIIIDDGSTDDSKDIIEQYTKNSLVSIIYQQNKGLNITNNVAMRAAKGKYLMRLDADDFLHPNALKAMSDRMESDAQLGLVFPDYFYIDSNGEILGEEKRHDFENDVKLLDQPAHGACTMIRLDYLKEVGGYNESYNCQDGYELWVKFTKNYQIANVSESLFYYRQHGSNLTGNETKILGTRAQINADFIQQEAINTSTLAIIPIRGGEQDLAFKTIAGENLLEVKIKQVLKSKNIKHLVVSSPDLEVNTLLKKYKSEVKIEFHHREKAEARYNQSLNPTISEIVRDQIAKNLAFEAILVLTLEFPLVEAYKIDDVVNTMMVFGSDSIIGVRADNSVFYQHHGDGLHPILERDMHTKLEREALFKQVGGTNAVTKSAFLKSSEMITGKVGHIVMDQRSSIGLFTKLDWEIAERLAIMQ
ncbi:MAG: glycosyltransferase [Cyclobacteriaceae bacterium]